jgi:cytochrome c553
VAEAGHESLAGVNKDELLKKMMDFKTGKKPATLMHQLSKGYTDDELSALAAYFSALKK